MHAKGKSTDVKKGMAIKVNSNVEKTEKMRDRRLSPEEASAARKYAALIREYNRGAGRKVYVQTFGCQQNEADSELLAGISADMGYEPTSDPDEADLILVNTCAVREHAEKKALSSIGQLKHQKRRRPDMIIGVCGCMVSQISRADQLKNSYPYVDFTFGTSSLYMLPELVWKRLSGGPRRFLMPDDEPAVAEGLPVRRESSYRAWVSIMYGCNNFCSYCIVPYVRGRERSRRPENIVEEVRGLVADGVKDITLLGQNVNSYGKGCSFDCDFADLIMRLADIDGDWKLHFMTSHPKDASHKLIDAMAANPHVARQLHLPLQSGSDRVLAAMNRHYDTARYLETVDYAREKMPDIVLSSDIIVGFPGETDEEFEATLDILRRVRYDMVYSFIYSPRSGTPAAAMTDQVPDEVKGKRMDALLALQTEISGEINRKYIGKNMRVLCDGKSKTDPNVTSARTEGGKIVLFDGGNITGEYVNVKITDSRPFALIGKKI